MDAAIFAAAVADYTPAAPATQKIKKSGDILTLELVKTKDILGSARNEMLFTGFLVGFAAETENVEANARLKLEKKAATSSSPTTSPAAISASTPTKTKPSSSSPTAPSHSPKPPSTTSPFTLSPCWAPPDNGRNYQLPLVSGVWRIVRQACPMPPN